MNSLKISKKQILYIVLLSVFVLSTAVLSALLIIKPNNTTDLSYYEKKCNVFEIENANFSHGQIVFIGDSITDGCALNDYYKNLPLAVYNRGIGGDTTSGVLERLKLSLFDIKPSKIVMLIGINDINGSISNEKILSNYREILSEISENLPDAEVICVSVLPVNLDLESYTLINVKKSNDAILDINLKIKSLALEFGYHFADLHNDFTDENGLLRKELSPDGIHLNADGYKLYSSKINPLLF